MTEIKIAVEKNIENPLLERREVEFLVVSEGATPKRKDVLSALAAELGVAEEQIVIEHIYNKKGRHESKCFASVYKKPVAKKEEAEKKESSEEQKQEEE